MLPDTSKPNRLFDNIKKSEDMNYDRVADLKTNKFHTVKTRRLEDKETDSTEKDDRVLDRIDLMSKLPPCPYIATQDQENKWMPDLGVTLKKFALKGEGAGNMPLNFKWVKHVQFSLLSGLQHMHDHSLAHRDVQLKNIFINPANGAVKLTEFDLTRTTEEQGVADEKQNVLGSWEYMSPELVMNAYRSTPYEDQKGDSWASGACLYELITGEQFITKNEKNEHNHIVAEAFGCLSILDFEKKFASGLPSDEEIRSHVNKLLSEKFEKALYVVHSVKNDEIYEYEERQLVIDCLKKSLRYDYNKRATVKSLLDNKIFGGFYDLVTPVTPTPITADPTTISEEPKPPN